DSQPVKLGAAAPATPAPTTPPPALDEEALAEREGDGEQRTPLVVAAKLAELVKRTARATLQPLGAAPQGSGVGPNALKEAEKTTEAQRTPSQVMETPSPKAAERGDLRDSVVSSSGKRVPWWIA